MARMIPPTFDGDKTSPGERDVFERLRDDPSTATWSVLHSLGIARHPRQVQGEVDFVIIVPGAGVLCLEVKSHRSVSRMADGRWQLGTQAPEVRGPFKQADEQAHALQAILRNASTRLSAIPVISAVCFTNCHFNVPNPTEWHPWQSIDAGALHRRPLSQLVAGVLTNARRHLTATPSTRGWFDPTSAEPTESTCANVVAALRPVFEFAEPPKESRRRREDEVSRFTQEQFAFLDMIADNKRCITKGPAGTGKTFMALESARRHAAEGAKVLLCCYNRLLSEVLRGELEGVKGVETSTLHRHMINVSGVKAEAKEPGYWTSKLPDLALEKLLDVDSSPYDVLVVDEAQDLMLDSYLDVIDASLRGGLAGGRWLMFGDFTNQAIYDSRAGGIELLQGRSSDFASISLRVNCRNVPAISQYVETTSHLNPGYAATRRPDNERNAIQEFWSDETGQDELLIRHLDRLIADGFGPEEIMILSPRSENPAARRCQDRKWSSRLAPAQSARSGAARYASIHAYKGLDAPAVIVTDIDAIKSEHEEALFYIATSRARDDLTILARSTVRADLRRLVFGEHI